MAVVTLVEDHHVASCCWSRTVPGYSGGLAEVLDTLQDVPPGSSVQLEFQSLETIGSTELSQLVACRLHLAQMNCELQLVGVNEHLREIFELTRLDQLIAIVVRER
jgi:anti-anti-sigma regulatory factor